MTPRATFVILAVLAFGHSGPEPVIPVTLHGQVVASDDTTPIRWAQVYVTGTRYGAVTDTLGYFTVPADLPAGSYTLTIQAIGYNHTGRAFRVDTAGVVELGRSILTPATTAVEDLIVTSPCTYYRHQPPDSLRRFIRRKGRDKQGRFWEVCKK